MQQWSPSRALTAMARPVPLQTAQVARNEAVRFGYSIGALNFLIGEGVLSELLRAPAIYPIPNVPVALRGYVNRQGALIPVWDIGSVLDCRVIDESNKQQTTSVFHRAEQELVLILGRDDHRVGVIIDGLPHVVRNLTRSARLPMLPSSLQQHVTAAMFSDSALWLEVNHVALLQSFAVEQVALNLQ